MKKIAAFTSDENEGGSGDTLFPKAGGEDDPPLPMIVGHSSSVWSGKKTTTAQSNPSEALLKTSESLPFPRPFFIETSKGISGDTESPDMWPCLYFQNLKTMQDELENHPAIFDLEAWNNLAMKFLSGLDDQPDGKDPMEMPLVFLVEIGDIVFNPSEYKIHSFVSGLEDAVRKAESESDLAKAVAVLRVLMTTIEEGRNKRTITASSINNKAPRLH
jgi:hypothetical protein